MTVFRLSYPTSEIGPDQDDDLFDLAMNQLFSEYSGKYTWFGGELRNYCHDVETQVWAWEATSERAALWLMLNAPAGYTVLESQ